MTSIRISICLWSPPGCCIGKRKKPSLVPLFDIGMKYDVIFSPLFTFVAEWKNGIFKEFPVYQEISRDRAVVL